MTISTQLYSRYKSYNQSIVGNSGLPSWGPPVPASPLGGSSGLFTTVQAYAKQDFADPIDSAIGDSSGLLSLYSTTNSADFSLNQLCRVGDNIYWKHLNHILAMDYGAWTSGLAGAPDQSGVWETVATPAASAPSQPENIGLYPATIGGSTYLITAQWEGGTSWRSVRYDISNDVWESGETGTLDTFSSANGIVKTEIFYDNDIYFITPQSTSVSLYRGVDQRFITIPWPANADVQHPMDLCAYNRRIYCGNHTSTGSGQIWEIDPVLGSILRTQYQMSTASGVGVVPAGDNYVRRNCLFTSERQSVHGGYHMVHLEFANVSGGQESPGDGWVGFAVAITGKPSSSDAGSLNPIPFRNGQIPNGLLGGYGVGSPSVSISRNEDSQYVQNTEEWQTGSTDGGSEDIWFIFRSDGADGSELAWFSYNDTDADWNNGIQPVTSPVGDYHYSYPSSKIGGDQRRGDFGTVQAVLQDVVQPLANGNTRIEFTIRTNAVTHNGTPVAARIIYADKLAGRHKFPGTLENANIGSITADNRLLVTANSGTLYTVEWNTRADGFSHAGRANFVIAVALTGVV